MNTTNKLYRQLKEWERRRAAAREAAIAALPRDTAKRTVRTVRGYHGIVRVEQRGICPVSARPELIWFTEDHG